MVAAPGFPLETWGYSNNDVNDTFKTFPFLVNATKFVTMMCFSWTCRRALYK